MSSMFKNMFAKMVDIFRQIDLAIEKLTSVLLIISFLLLMAFAVMVIIVRWMNITVLWMDPLIRHLVFLIAFLGGIIATGRNEHISINLMTKYFKGENKHMFFIILERVVHILCIFALLWLAKSSYDFFVMEKGYGQKLFFGIHSSVMVAVIFVSFFIIAYRFLSAFLLSLCQEIKNYHYHHNTKLSKETIR